ncbi:glycosyl transferase family 2 [Nocardioides albertanoniae]|uniref:Glycosyl transferase family 2 n=1 Tax=Nocardioides albertanoniae TaxID=1175486 RepID=A0A543A446_9ACTN|nr:glycosyltransferase family 2 protein [Nocardioides albertanoniae]TQL67324.1 glycosyl transferase family 2 [Nocardioides albertanoniae]
MSGTWGLRRRRNPVDAQHPERAGELSGEPPQIAVLTITRDEGDMLARWVDHYAAQVGHDNLLVFDDGSSDGSTDGLPISVQHLPGFRKGNFEAGRMSLASGVARGLLGVYDWVIFTDVDEFLIPDPAIYAGLPDYLARRSEDVLAPYALNVVHHTAVEGPLVAGEPILGQRAYAKFAPLMCKPSIKRVPAPWTCASHGIKAAYRPDPSLFMVHMKFADLDLLQRQADLRNELARTVGRGRGSSWGRSGDDLGTLLTRQTRSVGADVPVFDPAAIVPTGLVREEDGVHRAVGKGHIDNLQRQPLVRIPERLHGLV